MATEKCYKLHLPRIRDRLSKMSYRRKVTLNCFVALVLTVCVLIPLHIFTFYPLCSMPFGILGMFVEPPRSYRSCKNAKGNFSIDIKDSEDHYVTHSHRPGRLGNLMFETASTFGIAHTLKYKFYIEPSHPLLPYFEIKPSEYLKLENTITLDDDECRTAVWKCRGKVYSYNITVNGRLQSWKHFKDIFHTIREIFTIKPQYLTVAKNFLNSSIPDIRSRTVVGVHVRRADFLRPDFHLCGNTVASVNYLKNAMNFYKKQYDNAFFVFVSDDKKWCKQNIISDDVIFSDFKDGINDLAIMTLCDHNIITGGTFGWWGAWLAGGQVVYLKDWPWPGSWLDEYGMIKEDYFPSEWIGLRNLAVPTSTNPFRVILTFISTVLCTSMHIGHTIF